MVNMDKRLKRIHEIIDCWVDTMNLCLFSSIVRMFSVKQWGFITVSMHAIDVCDVQ